MKRLLLLFLFLSAACSAQVATTFDIPYSSIPGVEPNLLSLDIYAPTKRSRPGPVMLMVHGGSFMKGDKRGNQRLIHPKMDYYTARGWVFASVNYRLTKPRLPADHPEQVRHPDHIDDLAAAIAWTKKNIAKYGGDPTRIVLVGHSAGATLVALAGTDEKRMVHHGLKLSDVRAVVALDGFYDIPRRIPRAHPRMHVAVGSDTRTQRDLSPFFHVGAGKSTPPMLVVCQERGATRSQTEDFVSKLRKAGVSAWSFAPSGKNHSDIGGDLGHPDDPLTQRVDQFFTAIGLRQ